MINKELMAHEDRIVRCEDCVLYEDSCLVEGEGFCRLHSEDKIYVVMYPDDFCSYGQRKEQNTGEATTPQTTATYTRSALVISDTEAELIKRARSEMATKGEIGMDTTRAFLEARMAQVKAWEEERQKTK